jgi:hypothetical protein
MSGDLDQLQLWGELMGREYDVQAAIMPDLAGNVFDGWEVTHNIEDVPTVVAIVLDRNFAALLKSVLKSTAAKKDRLHDHEAREST